MAKRTVSVNTDTRDLLARHANADPKQMGDLLHTVLEKQLRLAEELRASGGSLAERYLTDPRGYEGDQTSFGIDATLFERINQLIGHCRQELGGVQASRQAFIASLLFEELEPLPSDAPRRPLPTIPPSSSITNALPAALHQQLTIVAAQRGAKRDTLVATLLEERLAALEQEPELLARFQNDDRLTTGGRGGSTIHLRRDLDEKVQTLAGKAFGGIKNEALQALLWSALDNIETNSGEGDDRPKTVLLDGELHRRLVVHLKGKKAASRQTIQQFIADAVEEKIAREQKSAAS